MDPVTLILAIAAFAGLYLAWTIGANDVANAMGTSVGSGALSIATALAVAALFEFAGATLLGREVTQTLRDDILERSLLPARSTDLMLGITGCLLAASTFIHGATYLGLPVSATHSVVGALIGFGLYSGGIAAVRWNRLVEVAGGWVLSPFLGAFLAFVLFRSIQRRVLGATHPTRAAREVGPWVIGTLVTVVAVAAFVPKASGVNMPFTELGWALGAGVVAGLSSRPIVARLLPDDDALETNERLRRAERGFLGLQVITACFIAFAHGSNDVGNAVGPLSMIFTAAVPGSEPSAQVPSSILWIGAVGVVLGLATYGHKVIHTVGRGITELAPSAGFAAEFGAATTIVIASKMGLPVSTTQVLVGSVVGVGLARSAAPLNTRVLTGIFGAWLVTLPVSALLAVLYGRLLHIFW